MAPSVTPRIMGVVNASLDSLTGGVDADGAARLAESMVAAGASVLDCGGQSLRTDQDEVTVEEEMARVLPVIEAVRGVAGDAVVSVDTYRAPVARAAIEAGARMVNDPSGLVDPALAQVVAEGAVEVVLAYSRATPKVRTTRADLVADPVSDALEFLHTRMAALAEAGVAREQVLVDPGPDLGKAPEQTIRMLHEAEHVRSRLGGPRMLWAVSRKDFVGALVGKPPSRRDPGSYGALAAIEYAPGDVVRVHDVAGVADFFSVRAALLDGWDGELDLPEGVRYEPG